MHVNDSLSLPSSKQDVWYECVVCTEVKPIETKAVCGYHDCKSVVCKQCFRTYVESRLDDGVFNTKCICGEFELHYNEITEPISAAYREMYERLSLNHWFASTPDVFLCPRPDCSGGGFLSNLNVPYFECNSCRYKICPRCKEDYHGRLTCEQYKTLKSQTATKEELENQKWKLQRTKSCPNCKADIEKAGGCTHMTCQRCKFEFCWICLKKYSKHHMSEFHFVAQANQPAIVGSRGLPPARGQQLPPLPSAPNVSSQTPLNSNATVPATPNKRRLDNDSLSYNKRQAVDDGDEQKLQTNIVGIPARNNAKIFMATSLHLQLLHPDGSVAIPTTQLEVDTERSKYWIVPDKLLKQIAAKLQSVGSAQSPLI